MKIKICAKCKAEKPLTEFNKNKNEPDGYQKWCRECCKEWKNENKEHIKEYNKDYQQKPEVIKKRNDKCRFKYRNDEEYRNEILERGKKRYKEHPDKVKANNEKNYKKQKMEGDNWKALKKLIMEGLTEEETAIKNREIKNKEEEKKQRKRKICRKSKMKNRDKYRERRKKDRKENPEKYAARGRKRVEKGYFKNKYRTDINYKLRRLLSCRIYTALNKGKDGRHTTDDIGCTIAEFKERFGNQFNGEMSWEAYMDGGIHIDHRIPCFFFNLEDLTERKICFHYSNLQPMWVEDHRKKHAEKVDKLLKINLIE